LVLYRRERAVMLAPRGRGIVVWTLRYGDEVREAEDYFAGIDTTAPEPKVLRLVGRMIAARTQDWSPSLVSDPVQERLKKIIAAKKRKGKSARGQAGARAAPPQDTPDNVVSIME